MGCGDTPEHQRGDRAEHPDYRQHKHEDAVEQRANPRADVP
jgi:hypothetical protein